MQFKVTKITGVQYGTYAKASNEGELKYLNVGHFDGFGKLTKFSQSYIDRSTKNMKFILRDNDVILAAKGSRNFAWAYKEEYGACIPSSAFYIIRMNPDEVLGGYLAYYLNTDKTQYMLKQMVTGSGMPSIPKKEFMELSITVPTIEKQKKIIEVAELLDEDIELTHQLLSSKKILKKGIINKMITNQTQI